LARRLGISQMTVSRVLHNRPGVSTAMQKRIRQAMAKYDYIPDQIASGLRTETTNVIGLVIPDVSDSYFPAITKGVEAAARKYGYSIILSQSNESYEQECAEVNLLRGFRVKGLIIAPSGDQDDIDLYQSLQKYQVPFVFIDRIKQEISCSYVITDERRGASEIGKYLLEKGYRKWGYLKGPPGVFSSDEHEIGLRASLQERPGNDSAIISVNAGFQEADGYGAVKKLLKKTKPDVIVAINDLVAIGAFRYLKEKGIKVPADIALVGFSDLQSVDILEVPLTTVREATAEIGERAMNLLFREISDPECPKQSVVLRPKLIVRDSA